MQKVNRLNILMESRILREEYVRFGGEYHETYHCKMWQGARYLACGAGKTLIMCVAAYEMKRLGLANKPMIIGLKANIAELAHTFRTAYPNAKVLAPSKNDFTPDKRERLFNDIKNNNWNCVILTHDQFGMIPQSPEIQRTILQAELDSVEENLELLRSQGATISKGMEKGLIKRQENLKVKLKEIAFKLEERRDDVADFKTMGIDHLLVDESHTFKNLMFNTRHALNYNHLSISKIQNQTTQRVTI